MEGYKSGKQRRLQIKAARRARRQKRLRHVSPLVIAAGARVPVDSSKLVPTNSYTLSEFAERGYYVDRAFSCCDCGTEEVWTAEQQRRWYETLGGSQYAFAKRCRACRRRERQRKELARQVSQAGLLKKQARLAVTAYQ